MKLKSFSFSYQKLNCSLENDFTVFMDSFVRAQRLSPLQEDGLTAKLALPLFDSSRTVHTGSAKFEVDVGLLLAFLLVVERFQAV